MVQTSGYIIIPEKNLKMLKQQTKRNKIQQSLVNTGSIHPYLRMFWAKKILEWSPEPEEALRTAIYLNDKYAYDAPSENGYTAILWSIGGLHDRAFRDMPVTGKIRRMGEKKIKNML